MRSYLQSINSGMVQDTAKWRTFSTSLNRAVAISDYFTRPSTADTLVLNTVLKSILAELKAKVVSPTAKLPEQLFWQQFCRSSLAEIAKKFSKSAEQVRDRQMGDNLVFLQRELYRDRKMIVWAASSHLVYNGDNIERKFFHQNPRLGDYIKQAYGEHYYHIGFTGYRGEIAKLLFFHLLNVKKHRPNSIEHLLGQTKQPFLFIDFHKPALPQWLQDPLIAMPLGYKETSMRLPLVMDGLFYIEEVFENHWLPALVTSNQKR